MIVWATAMSPQSVSVVVRAAAAATMGRAGGDNIAQKWSMIVAVELVHGPASPATRVESTDALVPAPGAADAAAAACAAARVAPGSSATVT